ncbi:hypothetical protein M407DRAFT_172934 [Tulasnella calospora MUT 4182]|uniref:Uncharacterized protein n=1 Tax=Tulasnella calospora MUT 4182 TaxID=1051891 RepID=A0A0C3QPD6_9AGAM|nr:hypothetical protein M407DRAFT_172934 [Tulasnella calospora MUT 4182]
MAGTTTSSRSSIGNKSRQMDMEGVQEKDPSPPPPSSIDTSALIGFPSPSSPYFSPQDPIVDFHRPKPKRPRMGASHTSGDASAPFASSSPGSGAHDVSGRTPSASGVSNHHHSAVTAPRGEKRGTPDDTSGGVSGAHGESKVTRRSRPISDPHAVGSTMSSGSSKDKASTPPQTRSRTSQRFSTPANGITPIMTNSSTEPPRAGSSAPPVQTPNQPPSSILDYFPEQKRLSLASERPAPASPGSSSRRQSAMPDPPRPFSTQVIPPTPTTAVPSLDKLDTRSLRRSADFVLLKIQDFGYAENDSRRQYDLTINLHDPPRPPSPAPPGFIPPMNMDETEESEASSNFGFKVPGSGAYPGGGSWLSKVWDLFSLLFRPR